MLDRDIRTRPGGDALLFPKYAAKDFIRARVKPNLPKTHFEIRLGYFAGANFIPLHELFVQALFGVPLHVLHDDTKLELDLWQLSCVPSHL